MKTMQFWKKLVAVFVVLTMLFSVFAVFAAAEKPAVSLKTAQSGSLSLSDRKTIDRGFKSDIFKAVNTYRYADDQDVTVIVVTEGTSAIEAGKLGSAAEKLRRNELKNAHERILAALDQKGISYTFLYDYTTVMNGFSLQMKYGDLDAASAVDGIRAIHIANEYTLPDETVQSAGANSMTGADIMNAYGFEGKGVLVAVLDTGTNTTHEAFADYGLTDGVTEEEVNAWIAEGLVSPGQYLSPKIPYAFDYADEDDDVTDVGIGHGTHVAGIAVGYAEDAEGNVTFSGAAPAAQLIAMKVFPDGSGSTNSAIYIKALEDAYAIGVDVINMSLGAPAGFTYDPVLDSDVINNIYRRLDDAGIITCVSAGNEYSQAYGTLNYYAGLLATNSGYTDSVLPTYYVDYGLIGTPATYAGNLSVASVNNLTVMGNGVTVGDTSYYMIDSSDDGLFMTAFGGKTLDYVLIPGVGAPEDYEGLDATGKIAVVTRGTISFQEKLTNAAAQGAIGMVCVNNQSGLIKMALDDYPVPAVSLPQAAAAAFAEDAVDGYGTLSVTAAPALVISGMGGTMSDFSNWGVTSDLAFGPMITGVGGFVYSAYIEGDQSYEMMSGTSMAAPNVAGNMANILSYLKTAYPDMSMKDRADMAEALAESTATVLNDGTAYYSPRKQGAGLVNSLGAATGSYIVNPLHSLKDSTDGVYTFTLTVQNLTDEDKYFSAEIAMMTDTLIGSVEGQAYMALAPSFMIEGDDYYVESDLTDGVLCVPAGSTADVTFTVTLDDYMMAYLDYYCEYGAYIDGYVFLDELGVEYPDSIHASFFGYYGDWTAAPSLELVDSYDVADAIYFLNTAVADEEGHTYYELGYGLLDVIGNMCVGYNEATLFCDNPFMPHYGQSLSFLGDNLFDYQPVNPAHAAISTPEYGWSHYAGAVQMTPAMLRNAEHIIMMVVDQETGEVYYIDDTAYVKKNLYDEETEEWIASTYFYWDGMDYSVEEPYYLANGTKVALEYYVILDYEDDGSYRTADTYETWEAYYAAVQTMAGESDWVLDVTVDSQLPVIDTCLVDEESGVLTLTLTDNEYLSYFGLYNEAFDLIGEYGFSDDEAGAAQVISLPLSLLTPGTYYLDVNDYATNYCTYEMVVTEDGDIHVFDPFTGYCLSCDMWTDGLYEGEFEYDPRYNVVDMYVSSAYDIREALAEEGFVFPIADLASSAAEMGAGMEFIIGNALMLTFDESATAQLAAQGDIDLTVFLNSSDNTVTLELSLDGADFSDGACEVYYRSDVDFDEDDVRVFYVDDEGSAALISYTSNSMLGLVYFMTSHFSHYEIVFLDEYGKIIESYVDQALSYAYAASVLADNAEASAAEAAKSAQAAADEAERAKAEADRAEASADEADGYAELARARADVAREQAEIAKAKADAAAENAKIARAQADAAQASADAAAASAAAAATSAENAEQAAAEAKQYADDAKNSLNAAELAAAKAENSATSAQKSADDAKKSADAASEAATAARNDRLAAEQAKAEAEAAKAAAEAARKDAEAAKAEAEAAKTASEAAKAEAEAMKVAAEAAKADAEAAQATAEAAQKDAEAAKTAAEAERLAAETAKTAAEAERLAAEAAKADAEAAKAEAEAMKVAAEAAHAAAEAERLAAEAAKTGAEADKAAAEAAKADAEAAKTAADNAKAAAEQAKADAEAKASAAEAAKSSAETAKAEADAAKVAAETAKAEADAAKVAAETAKAEADAAKVAAETAAADAKAIAEAEQSAADAAKAEIENAQKAAEAAKAAAEAEKAAAEKAKEDAEAAKTAAEAAQSAAESVLAEINAANEKDGCGAVVGGSIIMILSALTAAVALRKKH